MRRRLTTGLFVRMALEETGQLSGRELYRLYRREAERRGQRPAKYSSFMRTVFYLKHLGLIETVAKKPIPGRGVPETFYRMTPRGRRTPIDVWSNPGKSYYLERGLVWVDPATGRRIPLITLGKRRYSRRVKGIPPRPRGRPRREWRELG